MGYALADACARRGAKVLLVSGPVELPPPFGVDVIRVETAREMHEAVTRHKAEVDTVFMTAAVADYAPTPAAGKIKKTGGPLQLTMEQGPDILAGLGADKGSTMLVGFAAETDDVLQNARSKLDRKNLDYIVVNDVSRRDIGFDADDNAVTILGRGREPHAVPKASKSVIAEEILDHVFADGRDG